MKFSVLRASCRFDCCLVLRTTVGRSNKINQRHASRYRRHSSFSAFLLTGIILAKLIIAHKAWYVLCAPRGDRKFATCVMNENPGNVSRFCCHRYTNHQNIGSWHPCSSPGSLCILIGVSIASIIVASSFFFVSPYLVSLVIRLHLLHSRRCIHAYGSQHAELTRTGLTSRSRR